ncbi:MAG: HD domain-containing protein [candidate division Zixibacteria bacterium]|nr:HD domain-containing protein [candidate division Zixibacteria bacterium]
MSLLIPRNQIATQYLPIYMESLRIDTVLNFDLYIKIGGEMVLYRSADLPFTERTRDKLVANKVLRLHVSSISRGKYQKYIEQNLDKILTDQQVPEEKKAGILYDTSRALMKDVLENPTYGENIQRSKRLVENQVSYILKGQEAFHNLLRISSFDYYTYTHSVNVCTFAIALIQQMGCKDEQYIYNLGIGALLHDIGKSKISERILNKRTSLSSMEFELMKKHPKWGIELLTGTDLIEASSYYPVLQHHERGLKRGYPNGLTLDEMHEYSRIVAIVDTFDAMTTKRVYQGAIETFPALKVMFSLKGEYDCELLKSFAELMGPEGLASI